MAHREIAIIVDYRGQLYCPLKGTARTMDLEQISALFAEEGYETSIIRFADVDFARHDFADKVVIYQSSEDHDLRYKSYIEDVVLGLQLQGARLIPRYEHLRAHHNKVFMEILRSLSGDEAVTRGLRSRGFGTFEELARRIDEIEYPAVLKTAAGHTGKGVALVRDAVEAREAARRASRSAFWPVFRKNLRLGRLSGYVNESRHTNKFVVQSFVPGLDRDFRVVIFGDKHFVLERRVPAGDFRASGSGDSSWPDEPPAGLLDYARRVKEAFHVPFVHLDIVAAEGGFSLIEFQFLRFGTNSVQRSPHHFVPDGDGWKKIDGKIAIERELVRSVVDYLEAEPSA